MPEEKPVAERLREAQTKIKQFASVRDQLMRDVGAEEQKLEEAYSKLRELGVVDPEKLTVEQLQHNVADLQNTLAMKLTDLEAHLTQGETLIQKYQELQGQ